MNHSCNHTRVLGWSLVLGLLTSATVIGCATNPEQSESAAGYDVTYSAETTDAVQLPEGAMRGAQLWTDNCIRCHNIRPPKSLSDKKWEIVMMHMRVRASLTGEEQRQILRFLQAAN